MCVLLQYYRLYNLANDRRELVKEGILKMNFLTQVDLFHYNKLITRLPILRIFQSFLNPLWNPVQVLYFLKFSVSVQRASDLFHCLPEHHAQSQAESGRRQMRGVATPLRSPCSLSHTSQ